MSTSAAWGSAPLAEIGGRLNGTCTGRARMLLTVGAVVMHSSRESLYPLQNLRTRRVGSEKRPPVDLARQHRLRRVQRVVRRLDPWRRAAGLDRPGRLQEQPPRLDDGLVGGPEVLAGAVDGAPHALLHRPVLGIDPVDPREGLGLLHAAIQQVVVLAIPLGAEGRLVDVHGAVSEAALEAVLVGQRIGRALLPVVDHGGLVIHGHPDVAGRPGEAALARASAGGTDLMEGQDEVIGADMPLLALERPQAGIPIAVVRDVELERGRLAHHEGIARLEAGPRRVRAERAMQDGYMRGIDTALETLEPVALLDDLGDVTMRGGRLGPGEVWRRRSALRGPEIGPDDPARFNGRISPRADLVLESQLLRLVHHVHAPAVHVELPAVVDAAEPAVLVPAQEEGGLPVRAPLVEQSDAAPRIAEGHQLLAQQLDAHGRTIGLGQLPRQERGDPVPPHRLAHGGATADAGDSLVVFACQHAQILLALQILTGASIHRKRNAVKAGSGLTILHFPLHARPRHRRRVRGGDHSGRDLPAHGPPSRAGGWSRPDTTSAATRRRAARYRPPRPIPARPRAHRSAAATRALPASTRGGAANRVHGEP